MAVVEKRTLTVQEEKIDEDKIMSNWKWLFVDKR